MYGIDSRSVQKRTRTAACRSYISPRKQIIHLRVQTITENVITTHTPAIITIIPLNCYISSSYSIVLCHCCVVCMLGHYDDKKKKRKREKERIDRMEIEKSDKRIHQQHKKKRSFARVYFIIFRCAMMWIITILVDFWFWYGKWARAKERQSGISHHWRVVVPTLDDWKHECRSAIDWTDRRKKKHVHIGKPPFWHTLCAVCSVSLSHSLSMLMLYNQYLRCCGLYGCVIFTGILYDNPIKPISVESVRHHRLTMPIHI